MTLPGEAWGWLASSCVLLAWMMRRMRSPRLSAARLAREMHS